MSEPINEQTAQNRAERRKQNVGAILRLRTFSSVEKGGCFATAPFLIVFAPIILIVQQPFAVCRIGAAAVTLAPGSTTWRWAAQRA